MKLEEMKRSLEGLDSIEFQLPDNSFVPGHFHVTEVGKVSRHFIDCGGVERMEEKINFQLWNADDTDHRLKPQKLINIISLAERKLGIGNLEIEVEYQGDTIGKYGIDFNGENFLLTSTNTDCLAKENCGIPVSATNKIAQPAAAACTPGGGCC